jgi:hypothetical protein
MKRSLLIVLAMLAFAGCRRTDVREIVVTMPQLKETDKPIVEQALSKYSGIQKDSYRWDMAKKTLTLKYDSMSIAQTNIRMSIAQKGIEVVYPENTTGRAGY